MFWHKLALALGMSVADAQSKISRAEFLHWQAYYAKDPFGNERIDWLFGQLCCILANINRKKNSKSFKPKDFIPEWGKSSKRQTGRDMFMVLKAFAATRKDTIWKKG